MRLVPLMLMGAALAAADNAAAFAAAVAKAPGVVAAQARMLAAQRGRGAAGVMPDPMVGVEVGRERPRMGDDMTMYGAMIEQPLPRWGERDAQRQMASASAQAAGADFYMLIGEHAASLAAAGIEAESASRSLVLVEAARQRAVALGEVVRSRIAAGGAMYGESLAIDTRVQQFELQIADLRRRQADAESEMRGRLALAPEAPLPPVAVPDPANIQPSANPALIKAQAAQAEAKAGLGEAEARGRPESSLGLRWEREAVNTMDQSDTISLSYTMSLPVWRGAYDDGVVAARQRGQAAGHEAHAAEWMARSQISRAQRASDQARRAEALAESIATRTASEYAAVMRQVGTGTASISLALDLLDRITDAQLQAIEAVTASKLALAELWRLAPPTLPTHETSP